MSANLITEVLDLLEPLRGEWKSVAKQSGVSYSWLSKFFNGHIPNPGIFTLIRLRAYLPNHQSPPRAPVKVKRRAKKEVA